MATIRKQLPACIAEIELAVTREQGFKIHRIGEQMRIIRNTVLGQLKKNHDQMTKTKEYRRTINQYRLMCESVKKHHPAPVELLKQKQQLANKLEVLRQRHNVTFEYARKYGKTMRNKFSLPDAVLVLTICEMVWRSIETLLYKGADKIYFYKKDDLTTFQGKQANRCIILKQTEDGFHINFSSMKLPLIIKKDDLYIQETLTNISYYMQNGLEVDNQNITRYKSGQKPLSTYRICNNRIVRKLIRGKMRYYLQITLEGNPVPRRKKDGSIRHNYGAGRIGCDIGTQSLAIVTENHVSLKNLAERSVNTFAREHKICLLQRYMDRSKRATNLDNYNPNGTVRKSCKSWKYSNRYKKARSNIRELHRKAADSRKFNHNEEVNRLRAMGDELIIEVMDFKGLQKKAKTVTKNKKTGKFNRRKRFGKSIGRRSPGYFIKQAKYRFQGTGSKVSEVNNWSFKASQYDHKLDNTNKKQLSKRQHVFSNGTKVQRDIYSACLLYCTNETLQKPDKEKCDNFFEQFLIMHDACVQEIIATGKKVMNSGIKVA